MADVTKVTSAKPKIGGAIYSAPLGTVLPTDATTELNEAFKALGYISEDGLTNENTASTENIKAWGGDIVDTVQTEKTDKFTYTLIESNTKELVQHSVVIEMVLKGGILKRIVIPNGKIGEVGEIKYTDSQMVGFETTLNAFPDSEGNTHYEYIKKK